MARITRAAPHLSTEELKTRLKLDPRPWCRQRWLIIYNAQVEPREAADIAKHTGTTVAMVHRVIPCQHGYRRDTWPPVGTTQTAWLDRS